MRAAGRIAEALLRWIRGAGPDTEALLGDLAEQRSRDARRSGSPRAAEWRHVRVCLGLSCRYLWERLLGRRLWEGGQRRPGPVGALDSGPRRPPFAWTDDVRSATRALRRGPGFATLVIATLALGIGANVAIFSALETALFRPLPYTDPEGILQLWVSNERDSVPRWGFSLHDRDDWVEASSSLARIGLYNSRSANFAGSDTPERIVYTLTSPSVFEILGVPPALGRLFRPEEDLPGRDDVVLLSHDFWSSAFGGDSAVVGREVRIDGERRIVVGVMPRGFWFPGPQTQLWKPFGMVAADEGERGGRWVSAIGRLAPGVSLEAARQQLDALADALAARYPDANEDMGAFIERRSDFASAGSARTLWLTLAIVSLVLMIAFLNITLLLLFRLSGRSHELAVRVSLGASRKRLARMVATEGMVLAGLGGGLGLSLASGAIGWLRRLEDTGIPRLAEASLSAPAVAYALALTASLGLAFGAFASLRIPQRSVGDALRASGGRAALASGGRVREGLVVGELALAVIALTAGGLLLRSVEALSRVELGYDSAAVLTGRVAPSWDELPERASAIDLMESLVDRLAALPGVRSAAAVNQLPLAGVNAWSMRAGVVGRAYASDAERERFLYRTITPSYFETLGIQVLRGRAIDASDDAGATPVVVLSRTAAARTFPGEDAVGKRLALPSQDPGGHVVTVVGIVEDVVDVSLANPPNPLLYAPLRQATWGHFRDWGMSLAVRSDRDPGPLAPELRRVVREVAPSLPLFSIETLDQRTDVLLAPPRFTRNLLGSLGLVGLALATLGVFGVLSSMVRHRRREIGTRIALGAAPGQVVALVVGRGLRLAALGAVVGIAGGLLIGRSMGGLLFEVGGADPGTLAGVVLTLTLSAALACVLPAGRAAAVDPITCLNDD